MRAATAITGLWLVGCAAPPAALSAEESVQAIAAALRSGQIEQAIAASARGRLRHPQDGAVAFWSAVVADCLWQDVRAVDELAAAARAPGGDLAFTAEARGRLGELLFALGRWGEAAEHLREGAVGATAPRRLAMASLAAHLPWRRQQAGPLATEHPLLPGDLPEFACAVGALARSFAIDTGTSMTTLTESLASDVGVASLVPAGQVVDGTGRDVRIRAGILPRFAVGEVALGSVPVLVVDDAALALRDLFTGPERPPAGVLGLDVLSLFRLTVDPQRRTVVLELPRGLAEADSVQCVRADGRCLLPATVDDTRLWFALDTGASHSSLTEQGMAALPGGGLRAAAAFRRVHTAGGGAISVRELRDLQLRVSATRFLGVTLPVIARPPGATFPLHGVLGNDLLGRCRLTLDRGRLRLEVAS